MFGRNRRKLTAADFVLDSEIRRAALRAAPPVARLGLTVGKRLAQRETEFRLGQASQTFDTLTAMLTTTGPQLAEQLGLIETPRHRRVVPAALAATGVVVAVILATDPQQRQRVQRLFVH